ncbi:hypothetical protein JOF53_006503 [Crossiella equi]|uniref:Uncharacterized protein n=1 Tax=Crossiella equi TaxID=130796 RepID=A0ABS5AM47_9PSEU|nr:hypothetical protein [Crossiella equi]MBP2477631.1 hypothetical protein [Crossiella equi]
MTPHYDPPLVCGIPMSYVASVVVIVGCIVALAVIGVIWFEGMRE